MGELLWENVKMKRLLLVMISLVFLFASCNGEEEIPPEPSPEVIAATPSPSPTPEVPTPTPAPEHENPLTGLEIDEKYVNTRPYAVMLNNIREAQPQFSIAQADIVYEICAEGGITRMLALFQDISVVGSIGSIRSARPYYVELALGHDALFLHAGGSEQAYSDIKSKGVTAFDAVRGGYEGTLFWRDQQRISNNGYEHSVFTNGETALRLLSGYDIRHEHEESFVYDINFDWEATPENGYTAETVSVQFSSYKTATFEYDSETRLYGAKQYGGKHIDADNGEQVAVSNLFVLYTGVRVLDDDGRLSVEVIGSGEGQYFCGGQGVDVTWTKPAGEPITYALKNGEPLTLERGRSYVCIVKNGSSVTVE